MIWLGAVAVAIVACLAVYALWLWRQVYVQQRHRVKRQQQQQQALAQLALKAAADIRVLASASLNGECCYSEAAIRICRLLQKLDPKGDQQLAQRYHNLYQLYLGVKDQPTHAARDALPRQQRMRNDLARSKLEAELGEALQQELSALQQFSLTR